MLTGVLFFGQHTVFSRQALEVLVRFGIFPRAVVVACKSLPGPEPFVRRPFSRGQTPNSSSGQTPNSAPFGVSKDLRSLCQEQCLDVIETTRVNHPLVLAQIASYRPDLLVTVGFNTLFGPRLLALPAMGAINVHPSLLPRWRGPSPFFWIFRHGDWESAGVTLHHMDHLEDHGPVLARAPMPWAARDTILHYLADAGRIGGELVRDLLIKHPDALPRGEVQDHGAACRAPRPTHDDLALDPASKTCEQLERFINSMQENYTLYVDFGGDRFHLAQILDTRPGKRLYGQYALKGDRLYLQAADGLVVCELAGPPELI